MRGAVCGSDHHMVRAKIVFPYRLNESVSPSQDEQLLERIELPQYNLSSLIHESTRTLYKTRMDSKLDETLTNTKYIYENIISSIHQTAQEVLGIKQNKISNKVWWNEDVENAVTEKKRLYHKWLSTKCDADKDRYNEMKKKTRKIIMTSKNETWDRKCREIESYIGGRQCTEAWKFINSVKKPTNEKVILNPINPEDWTHYYKHLLNENRDEFKEDMNSSRIEILGEHITIDINRVQKAIAGMKNGKASGPEGVTTELIKNGSEKLHRMITGIFNEYINGHPTPDKWKTAYMTPIYKKGDRRNCKNYRGISVTSSMSRLYGRILRDLIEEDYQSSEDEEQGGFRAGRSCTDNIFCLKQIIEKKVVTNRELHMTFVDLEKAYDTVPLNKLWEVLGTSNIHQTLVSALKDLYYGSNSQMKFGNLLAEKFAVTKGLRQGCCISPTLFKIYISAALKQWKRKVKGMGIQLNDQDCIYTLQFADDQVVISNDKDDMEYMLRKLIEEYQKWGLNINLEKTKYLSIGAEAEQLDIEDNQKINPCDEYKYLGVIFDRSGKDEREIEHRIIQARRAIACLNGVLWSKEISKKRKWNIYETMVKTSLLYGAETWRITEKYKKKVEATEMDAIRRSMRISRAERIRNEVIKQQMGVEGTIVEDIERKQLIWYGHVSRMGDERLPKKTMMWQPPEKKKRGRPPQSWNLGVRKAISARNLNEDLTQDRIQWRLGVGQRRKTL